MATGSTNDGCRNAGAALVRTLRARFTFVAAALLVLVTGCSTEQRRAEDRLLAAHSVRDIRMSNHAQDGFVPSGVWRIRGPHNTLYLAGTSHVLPPGEAPFPSPFYAAYQDAQIIYIEFDTDLSWFMTMRLVPRVLKLVKAHDQSMVPPKGKTLADYLSPETLDELRARYGKDYRHARLTPVALMFMGASGSLEGGASTGVEEPFRLLARRDGKPVRELDGKEVIDTAFLVMEQIITESERNVERLGADAAVREALLEPAKDNEQSSWRHGNLKLVMDEMNEVKSEDSAIYQKLLPERNRRWMRELDKVLHGKKNAFVLVGVGHLGGEDGLLNLLQKAGYTPEQMYGIDRPAVDVRE